MKSMGVATIFVYVTILSLLLIDYGESFILSSIRRIKIKNNDHSNSILKKSLFDDLDEEDAISFKRIATNYLRTKYRSLKQASTKDKVSVMIRDILPPLSKMELVTETSKLLTPITSSSEINEISEDKLIDALVGNSYWAKAGPVVVQELIYLDSLHNYYHQGAKILNDEDYAELKNQLQWSGSDVSSMSGKEALFITAVASHRRGESLLDDKQYESLKQQLLADNSWVVKRGADGLEKLGIDTFLGYLHRTF